MQTSSANVSTELQDQADIALSHHHRLSLKSKPTQSSFRVLALLFYTTPDDDGNSMKKSTLAPWIAQTTSDERTFILGTNDEPGYMGGAICAERAALVQLRFVPNFRITKLVIATDSIDPITPGLLCREFLAGHSSVPWDMPIICTGCGCTQCGKKDDELFLAPGGVEALTCTNGTAHSIPTMHTTIRHLYPHPSPYTRLTSAQSVTLGQAYNSSTNKNLDTLENPNSKRLLEMAIAEAQAHVSDVHPIQFGAAVLFDDGRIVTSHQVCALEYGCTLDAVSQLATHFLENGAVPNLLVQADQFGIAHAPFAPARAFLTEHKFHQCRVVVHDTPVSDDVEGVFDIDQWSILEVNVSDIAPDPPSWTEGV